MTARLATDSLASSRFQWNSFQKARWNSPKARLCRPPRTTQRVSSMDVVPGGDGSGDPLPALFLATAVERRRLQVGRIEVVDGDRVQGHGAQLLELHPLLGGDPALGHALVQLRGEVQGLDVAVL